MIGDSCGGSGRGGMGTEWTVFTCFDPALHDPCDRRLGIDRPAASAVLADAFVEVWGCAEDHGAAAFSLGQESACGEAEEVAAGGVVG